MIRKFTAGLAGLFAAAMVIGGIGAGVPVTGYARSAPVTNAVSGLAVIPLKAKTSRGVHMFRVEVAATQPQQERGLMFRTAMGSDEGMIFPYNPPQRTAFWMKNTVIGLDIVYIGTDHRVLNIARNAVPYDETPLPSAGAVSGVLELNAGRAAQIGLMPGDKVTW